MLTPVRKKLSSFDTGNGARGWVFPKILECKVELILLFSTLRAWSISVFEWQVHQEKPDV